ncbi:hypothetical protein [Paenibacillus graminis]|uniref:hypothetical protein n=1 Tax=Paenibacillus graminis TaxID=189425 RepID=UPI002DBBF4FE|nr:hypothetical protein [Paenibacillus graminis]MEC0172500.1 hypothetical protein [Paenibacillus graminis]
MADCTSLPGTAGECLLTVKSEAGKEAVLHSYNMLLGQWNTEFQELDREILLPTRNNLLRVVHKLSSPESRQSEKHPEVAEHLVLLMKNHNQQAMFIHKLELYNRVKAIAVQEKLYFLIGEYKLDRKREFIKLLTDGGFRYQVIPGPD